MSKATAVSVRTESGDYYLWCEEDGFTSESLTKFLKEKLGDEFPWVNSIEIDALGWDKSTLSINKVFGAVYAELDKI